MQFAFAEDPSSTRPALYMVIEKATKDDDEVFKTVMAAVGSMALEAVDQVRSHSTPHEHSDSNI